MNEKSKDFEHIIEGLAAVQRVSGMKITRNFTDFFADRIRVAGSQPDLVSFFQRLSESVGADVGYIKRDLFADYMKAAKGKHKNTILKKIRQLPAIISLLCSVKEEERVELLPDIELDNETDMGRAYPIPPEAFDIPLSVRCLSPLSHGDDYKAGNSTMFRRISVITDTGQNLELPYYAGNALRGQMRDLLGDNMLQVLGIPVNKTKPVLALWFFHLLYSGGSLSESGKEEAAILKTLGNNNSMRMEGINEVRNLFPHLSLMGFAVGNKILSGRFCMGDLRPVCDEWGFDKAPPVATLLDWLYFTRREDYEGDEDVKNESMIVNTECLIAGTLLQGGIDVSPHATELEQSALVKGLELLKERGAIGASNRQGYGKIDLEIPATGVGSELYDAYLRDNKERIRAFLDAIKATVEPAQEKIG